MRSFILFLSLVSFLSFPAGSNAQIGNNAPNFTVTDTHGNTHTLYSYLDSGKVVILDFFFTTCGPCQFYSPQVNLAYEKYGCNDAKTFFMSIDYGDNNAQVLAYDQQFNIHYPSVSGTGGGGNAVANAYNIIGYPTFYVIDSTRKIIEVIDPPTLQVFDYRFNQHGIAPAQCLTGAAEPSASLQPLLIFPNPAGSKVQVQMPESVSGTFDYQMYNATGQLIGTGEVDTQGGQQTAFDVGQLPQGMFFIKMVKQGGNARYWGKFVKE